MLLDLGRIKDCLKHDYYLTPRDGAELVAEVERLRGAILAALDNLENGPEGAMTAEGALRLALNAD